MKKIYLLGIIALIFVTGLAFVKVASANPSTFPPVVNITCGANTVASTASTSPCYMNPGLATSTLTFDTYYPNTVSGNTYKANSAVLLTQFTGSSSVSVLHIEIEYSQDGVDWYRDDVFGTGGIGTTTGLVVTTSPNSFEWKFASSTVNGIGLSTTNGATSTKAIVIPTPTRYIRIVHSLNIIANGNGSVWSQLVPVKEAK